VRIGLPTKTYYPTIIAETALRQKLFDKEGIKAELTIYRGGAEAKRRWRRGGRRDPESASSVAAGIQKGVMAKNVAGAALGYYGWHLVVKTDSAVRTVKDLAGKKSASRRPGRAPTFWPCGRRPTARSRLRACRLAVAGWCRTLISGNYRRQRLYSPLTYKMFLDKTARSLIDFGAAVPPNMTGAWMATDRFIKEKPQLLQKTLNALYGGLAFLQTARTAPSDQADRRDRRDPPPIAEAELDGNIVKLSKDGEMKKDVDGRSRSTWRS
jgi:NitT/TauT family transport system substrate-binding protein